jgi:hypothetical protein
MCQESGIVPLMMDAFNWVQSKASDLLGIGFDELDFDEVDKELDDMPGVLERRRQKLVAERQAMRQQVYTDPQEAALAAQRVHEEQQRQEKRRRRGNRPLRTKSKSSASDDKDEL